MFRTRGVLSGFLQGLKFGTSKNDFFTSLWNKPQTRDERVKEYVPEVMEESLEEQRAVLEENTSRDVIVELGNKILVAIENKSPTPSIAPNLNLLLSEYDAKDIITQRPLSYLLYPNSSAIAAGEQPHELVAGFVDHFRALIEEVERNGCTAKRQSETTSSMENKKLPSASASVAQEPNAAALSSSKTDPTVIVASREEYEPMDITMFVKVSSGMALANFHCADLRNAIRCVDAGIAHVVDPKRLGGLLALKAGFLVHQKKYEEAVQCAQQSIEASGNQQGFLQGAYALRMLHRYEEAVALLEQGCQEHPMNTQLSLQLEAVKNDVKLALPPSSSEKSLSGKKSADPLLES